MPMFPPEVHRSHLTPLRFLQRSASVFREKPAVIYGDRSWTYPELAERVNRLASALISAGVARGDRVAYLVPNIPAMLEGHFARPPGRRDSGGYQHALVGARGGVHPRALRGQGPRRRYRARAPGRAVAREPSRPRARGQRRGRPRRRPPSWSDYEAFSPPAARTRSTGRSRTRTRRSPSTTPRAPPVAPRA